jgi:hypothetical protein
MAIAPRSVQHEWDARRRLLRPPCVGRHVDATCAFIYTLSDGFIVHERRVLDFTGVLVQVGVLRAKPAAGA